MSIVRVTVLPVAVFISSVTFSIVSLRCASSPVLLMVPSIHTFQVCTNFFYIDHKLFAISCVTRIMRQHGLYLFTRFEDVSMENFELNQRHISKCIKVQLAKNELSITDLADKMGVCRMTANNYRSGKINDLSKIWQLCRIFGVTFDELLEIK